MKALNFAIIGMGHVFDYQVKALQQIKETRIVAVADIDENKKEKVASNIRFYKDYKEMILKEDIDVVLVSVPNRLHYEVTKFCLQSSINVLLEKPATLNLSEFNELITVSKTNNLVFVIAFHAMFAKDLLWFLENFNLISKETGKITYFYCGFFDPYIKRDKLKSGAESLIGSWIDSGINALSVIGKLVDVSSLKIKESKLTYLPTINPFGEIQGSAMLSFNGDYIGIIDTNWTLDLNCKKTHLKFENPDIEILLNHSKQEVVKKYKNKEEILVNFSGERLVNHYVGVFKDFILHYKNKTNNLEFAYKLHHILLNVRQNNKVIGCQ